jgi:signal transduction histidine kinase
VRLYGNDTSFFCYNVNAKNLLLVRQREKYYRGAERFVLTVNSTVGVIVLIINYESCNPGSLVLYTLDYDVGI